MSVALTKLFWALLLAVGIYLICDGLGLEPWVPEVKEVFRATLPF